VVEEGRHLILQVETESGLSEKDGWTPEERGRVPVEKERIPKRKK